MSRKRKNGFRRKRGHDYRSVCIYHIVLSKAESIDDFSFISGEVVSHHHPPRALHFPKGRVITQAFKELKKIFPFIWIRRRCVMPDHLHFVIHIREKTEFHLGEIIKKFKLLCSDIWESMGNPPRVCFFEDNYYDVILRGEGQLKKMLDYVSDNPRRWLMRKLHKGYFHRFYLTNDNGNYYEAYGNWDLLKEPVMTAVRFSRKYSQEELDAKKRSWIETVMNDGVWVSPFIHQVEKSARDWAIDNGGAFIMLRADGFGERYKPPGRFFDLCTEGRLLEIYLPPEGENALQYLKEHRRPNYLTCQAMNNFAALLAEGKLELQLR